MKQVGTFLTALSAGALFSALGFSLYNFYQFSTQKNHHPTSLIFQPATIKASAHQQGIYELMAAEIAVDRDLPDEALKHYIAALKQTQNAAIAERATQLALGLASLGQALEPALIWANNSPNNLEAQITVGTLYLRLNQPLKAQSFMEQAINLDAETAYEYFIVLYEQLPEKKASQDLAIVLEKIAEHETKHFSAHLALAQINLITKHANKALQLTQQVLQHQPNSIDAIRLQAQALASVEGKLAAKSFMEKALQKNTNKTPLAIYYIEFLAKNHYSNEAIEKIKQLSQKNLNGKDLLNLARISLEQQWFDVANNLLLKAHLSKSDQDTAHYFLARIAEMQNKPLEAIEWFKQVLTGQFHVASQIRASLLLAELGKHEEGLNILLRTKASEEREKKEVLLAAIEILNQSKRFMEAFALLEDALKALPDDIDLRFAHSMIALQLNQRGLAEEDLKRILQIEPERAEALDALGWLYYKNGDYDLAKQLLQKAASLGNDAIISAHLGEVLWHFKDYQGAQSVWQKAQRHFPNHALLNKTIERFINQTRTIVQQ